MSSCLRLGLFFYLLLHVAYVSAQHKGFDPAVYRQALAAGTPVLVDSLTIRDDKAYHPANGQGDLYALIQFLQEEPRVHVQLDLIVNQTYDTLHASPIRTRGSDIIHTLKYFGLPSHRYSVRERVIADKATDRGSAKRILSGTLSLRETASSGSYRRATGDRQISDILEATTPAGSALTLFPQRALVQAVLDRFQTDVYLRYQPDPRVLPDFVTIQLGQVDTWAFAEEEFSAPGRVAASSLSLLNGPESSFVARMNLAARSGQRILSPDQITALNELIGKDFAFDRQEMTSFPLREEITGHTQACFNRLRGVLPVSYYVNELGGCNGRVFWQFDWNFVDTYVPHTITIDAARCLVSVAFFNDELEERFVVYQYNKEYILQQKASNLEPAPLWRYRRWSSRLLFGGMVFSLAVCLGVLLAPRVTARSKTPR